MNRRLLLQGSIAATLASALPARAQSDTAPAKPGAQSGEISPVMRTVSDYIAGAAQFPLPDAAAEATRHHLLDTLAAMVSGSRLLPGQRSIAYVKTLGGTPEACVPGTHILTNAVNAALAGGMLAHADETDDSHAASLTHPGCGVVPAALAMAERGRASGMALLRAVALGYDICARMSMALGSYAFARAGHDTHTFGPMFGAAAACASILRLDAGQVRYVLSYTAQQAAGLSNYGSDTEHVEKAFEFGGLAARNGAAAATMVASGMSGHTDVFAGERNFFFAFGPNTNPDELTRDLGTTFEVVNTDIKRWTVGSPIQATLDSLYELIKANGIKADDVARVVVRISHQGKRTVDNRAMPDISLQHMVAVMLIDGTASFRAAHDLARMQDPKVLALRPRIELIGDDELERIMPSRQAIVEVTMRDGRVLRHRTEHVRGTPGNPMTRDEVGEKAFDLCAPILGKARAHALVQAVWNLDATANVRALRSLLQA
jgi:2-methylcitrate dehydratase PrpD